MYLSYKENGSITSSVIYQEPDQGNWVSHQEEVSVKADQIFIESGSNTSITTLDNVFEDDMLVIDGHVFQVTDVQKQLNINRIIINSVPDLPCDSSVQFTANGRWLTYIKDGKLKQHSVSQAFTISLTDEIKESNLNFSNIFINYDNTTAYQFNNQDILIYSLDTPGDVSQMTLIDTITTEYQINQLYFTETKMFLISDKIYIYEVSKDLSTMNLQSTKDINIEYLFSLDDINYIVKIQNELYHLELNSLTDSNYTLKENFIFDKNLNYILKDNVENSFLIGYDNQTDRYSYRLQSIFDISSIGFDNTPLQIHRQIPTNRLDLLKLNIISENENIFKFPSTVLPIYNAGEVKLKYIKTLCNMRRYQAILTIPTGLEVIDIKVTFEKEEPDD